MMIPRNHFFFFSFFFSFYMVFKGIDSVYIHFIWFLWMLIGGSVYRYISKPVIWCWNKVFILHNKILFIDKISFVKAFNSMVNINRVDLVLTQSGNTY